MISRNKSAKENRRGKETNGNYVTSEYYRSESSCGNEIFYALMEGSRRLIPLQENILQGEQNFCRPSRQVLAGRAQYGAQFPLISRDSSQQRKDVKDPAIACFRHRLANVVGVLDRRRCRALPTCRPILTPCIGFAR